ncbi:Protein of unknown function [Paramicrobacterium humi]|uniref:Uncharacterized protein n=1 Tax=Paramicrobacterium humi TaxID=640635 RepID=A0A1H4MF71_9MICO|nr:LapA family protein [Microbacterium humi]SEB81354.1 Protein of unknown function [Microbacterium humi]
MSDDTSTGGARRWLASINWIALVLVILVIVFMVQNAQETSVAILWVTVRWPLWLAMAIVFVLSFAAGYLARGRRFKRQRKAMR